MLRDAHLPSRRLVGVVLVLGTTLAAACSSASDQAEVAPPTNGEAGAPSPSSSVPGPTGPVVPGGPAVDGGSAGDGALGANGACWQHEKQCGPSCVSVDDPRFGCRLDTCAPCSLDPAAVNVCAEGACKFVGCLPGYKECGGKCVSIDDPTYGCGPTSCDATACPALDGGAKGVLTCSGGACVIGTCGPGTKQCGSRCVPTDRNNGCNSDSCNACNANQVCAGAPSSCQCVPDNVTPCLGKSCGTATNNCGQTITCGSCASPATCGGGGVPNQCGCTPQPVVQACAGRTCGTAKDSCGNDVICGTCAAPETCGGGGEVGKCGCTAEPIATTCAGKACGMATNNCGDTVWCPSTCGDDKTCDASNQCVDPPSCLGLGPGQATCGSAGETCCKNKLVTGGTFNRHNDPSYPAKISSFRLDVYEVTVKRYEAFKFAWLTQGWRPGAGAGKHRHLQGGLNGNEAGWDTSWVTDSLMHVKASDFDTFLACGTKATWGGTQGDKPINCVTWWEAEAFCIWDGGFLPSAAEWNYAAAGGSLQQERPGNFTVYNDCYSGSGTCSGPDAVGTGASPSYRVGRWGQYDLLGNVAELSADRPASATFAPPVPCVDCAANASVIPRYAHGGSWWDYAGGLTTRVDKYVTNRSDQVGFRCARLP